MNRSGIHMVGGGLWWGENGDKKGYIDELGSKLAQLSLPATTLERLLGIFNRHRKIWKHTDTDVSFTWEYSRVWISMGNMKCTRESRPSKDKDKRRKIYIFLVDREESSRVFWVDWVIKIRLTILYLLWAVGPFQLSNKTGKKVVRRRLPKALRNTNPNVRTWWNTKAW
jgi:hypothetical protein